MSDVEEEHLQGEKEKRAKKEEEIRDKKEEEHSITCSECREFSLTAF